MKITDLAALVQVRNHILTVINDKSVTNRDEFKPLNEARLKLDRKFVEIVKDLDADSIFPNELTLVKVGDSNYTPTPQDLEYWKEIFEEAQHDKDFKIFTHSAVSVTQLEIDPNSKISVVPAVEPRTIEVSPNISITKKSQLNLPFDAVEVSPVSKEEALKGVESSGRSGDRASSMEIAVDTLSDLAGGYADKLEEKLDKLEEQGVKIAPALVEEAVKPIQVPEEVKQAAVEKARKAKQAAAAEDPEIADAIARQKAELKKQGRSNKKVKRANDE